MSELILCDSDGHEVGRRPMGAEERYVYYRAWAQHDLVSFDNKRYRIDSVAWRLPEENLVLGVIFDSWEPCDC